VRQQGIDLLQNLYDFFGLRRRSGWRQENSRPDGEERNGNELE
jgi:hypothetical protein